MDTIAENQPPVKQSELPTPTTGPNMDILAELDHLADLRDQQALLDLKRNELRDVVLAPIAQQLADIDAETGAGLRRHQHGTPRCGDESQGVHPGRRQQHQGYSPDDRLRQGQN